MLQVIRTGTFIPQRRPRPTAPAAVVRTRETPSDWLLRQFATDGELGGRSRASGSRPALSLHVSTGRARGAK